MEEIESHEDRFMLNIDTDLPSLLEISSYTVARSIWDNYTSRTKPSPSSIIPYYENEKQFLGLHDNYLEDCDKMVDSLETPTPTKKIVKNSLNRVAKEMLKWHSKLYWTTGVYVRDSNYVLLANGKLDYRSSIIKICAGNRLSSVQKFALMSEFCLEDEIVKFPLDSLPTNFLERTNFHNEPVLIQYWFYYAKNELHKIPRSRGPNFTLFGELALKCDFGRWVAFEYFWNHMDSNEQMSVVTAILNVFPSHRWDMDQVLSLMSGPQQRRLFSMDTNRVIWKFFWSKSSVKLLRWIWTHYENSVTDHIFVEIIKSLFQSIKTHVEEWMSWLVNLWDAASEQRKIYTVQDLEKMLLSDYANSMERPSPLAVKFLCKFLSMLDAGFRKRIMLEHAEFFGIRMFDPDSVNELMNLCLPDVDDQAKFKKMFIECDIIKYDCVGLMYKEDFDKLNAILEFCLPTSNEVRLYKKMLLESDAMISTSTNFSYQIKKWNALCKIINEVYPEDESLVLQTKKRLIKLYLNKFFPSVYDGTLDVTQMIQIVESELTEDELNPLKYSLFHSFESKLKTNKCSYQWYRRYLNEMCFRQFVKWCVGDDDGAVLKYGTFIDTVLDGVLNALNNQPLIRGQRRYLQFDEPLLFNLNQFLLWHLLCEEKVKEYKVRRVYSPSALKIFKTYSENNESTSLEVLLKWFFGADELAICEFKSKCNFS